MEWEIYYQEHPFGQQRQDVLLGTLIQLVFNAVRSSDLPPLTLQDILDPKPPKTPAEAAAEDIAFIDAMVATGKVVDIRKKRGDRT
jgi:hypothetical protein